MKKNWSKKFFLIINLGNLSHDQRLLLLFLLLLEKLCKFRDGKV